MHSIQTPQIRRPSPSPPTSIDRHAGHDRRLSQGAFVDLAARTSLRVLLAGDTHRNTAWIERICATAFVHGCDLILQLGDFGFDPTTPLGRYFLDRVSAVCGSAGVELWWIDGNHENHHALAELRGKTDGPIQIRPHVWHLPRGLRLTLAGRRFGFLGGAFSVDWRSRVAGVSWWPNEVPTVADLVRLGDRRLDVLVCHDAPDGVAVTPSLRLQPADQVRADDVRDLLRAAVEATRPVLVLHGHRHQRHTTELSWITGVETATGHEGLKWRSAVVEGLDRDGKPGGVALLDLPSLTVRACPRMPVPTR